MESLNTTEKLPHQLITIKDMGGLSYSTEDVYKICLATKTVIRIKQSGGISLSAKNTFSYITVFCSEGGIYIVNSTFF